MKRKSIISLMLVVVMVLASFSVVWARGLEIVRPTPGQRDPIVTHLGGFYGISYKLAEKLLSSPAIAQFDEFFGAGAALATITGPNFHHLAALLGADLLYEIIEIENMVKWLDCILDTAAMDDLKSLYIWHPYAILRFNHFYNYYLPQIVDGVRMELVNLGIIETLDMSLSHEFRMN